MERKLNLGCGLNYREGWINVDNNNSYKTDRTCNLEKFPYPFKSNTFNKVYCGMILEHLNKPAEVLKEIHRICKNGAKITIIVPHADSYANKTDLQHKNNFTENSFDQELLKEYGLEGNFVVAKVEFIWKHKWKKYLPLWFKKIFNNLFDDIKFELSVSKLK